MIWRSVSKYTKWESPNKHFISKNKTKFVPPRRLLFLETFRSFFSLSFVYLNMEICFSRRSKLDILDQLSYDDVLCEKKVRYITCICTCTSITFYVCSAFLIEWSLLFDKKLIFSDYKSPLSNKVILDMFARQEIWNIYLYINFA